MTQDKNQALNYIQYFNQIYGVTLIQETAQKKSKEVVQEVDSFSKSSYKAETSLSKKINWQNGLELLQKEESFEKKDSKARYIFINQNFSKDTLISLFKNEYWELFKKMVASLELDIKEIEVWETNESEMGEIYHFLLNFEKADFIFLLLAEPIQSQNIYLFNKAKVLETHTPLRIHGNTDLKRVVWNHFKEFKSNINSLSKSENNSVNRALTLNKSAE